MNIYFLWKLLNAIPGVECVPINGGEGSKHSPILHRLGFNPQPLSEIDKCDVIVEAGAQVSAEVIERCHRRGGKAIAYRFGNAFAIDSERAIHNKQSGSIFNGARFDEIWTNAQHMRTCASYWETCYRAPVRCLPHIWDSTFVDIAISEFPAGVSFGYDPKQKARNIGIFEPNINLVKTCHIPMLVCEQAHRSYPQAIGDIYVLNALELKKHLTFEYFAKNLDIVKSKKCSFEGRFNTPWFVAKRCDVVVSHQWECALNYAYYDVLYGGYPLVHNSDLLPSDVGYRYDGFDAKDGAKQLLYACCHHDGKAPWAFLDSVKPLHPTNVKLHADALREVWERKS